MEGFRLFDPSFKIVRWGLHGQDHGGDLLVQSSGELGDGSELIFELGFVGQIFKLIDVFLEPIIWGPVLVFSWFLVKFGQVSPSPDLGVKGVKVLVIVFSELCEGFVFSFDVRVRHFVIPFFGEGYSFSCAHLAKDQSHL